VLEEYRLRSSAVWGESLLVRFRQIIVAMNSLSYTTQELTAAMGCLAIAMPPELVKELQEACKQRKHERRREMIDWIVVFIGYLGLLYFVFMVLK
jgi:transaldolase